MRGLDAFSVTVRTLEVKLNRTSVTDGGRLDWSAVSQTAVSLTGADQLSIGGTFTLEIAGAVLVGAVFEVAVQAVSDIDDPDEALSLFGRGVAFIETWAIADLLADPRLHAGAAP